MKTFEIEIPQVQFSIQTELIEAGIVALLTTDNLFNRTQGGYVFTFSEEFRPAVEVILNRMYRKSVKDFEK